MYNSLFLNNSPQIFSHACAASSAYSLSFLGAWVDCTAWREVVPCSGLLWVMGGPPLQSAGKGVLCIMSQSSSIVINKILQAKHRVYSSVQISRISSKYCYTKDDSTGCTWGPLLYID